MVITVTSFPLPRFRFHDVQFQTPHLAHNCMDFGFIMKFWSDLEQYESSPFYFTQLLMSFKLLFGLETVVERHCNSLLKCT